MVEINGITFSYGRRKPNVFEDFSLSFRAGSIYGLLGKNGTGKSTLLYLISGLLRPQRGSITVDGETPQLRRPGTLQEIFLVPEEFDLPSVRMMDYVRLNQVFYPRFSQEVLESCLRDFDLPLDINLGELSMGQKKKAYMCFALATNTRLLLMDEPTNGLDIPAKSQFRKVVSTHMDDDRTLVISTHQVRDVEMLIDHVAVVDGTRLLLESSTADICDTLKFEERPMGQPVDDVLYAQPSIHGNSVIRPNDDGEDTLLDLELLFNALQAVPALATRIRKYGQAARTQETGTTNPEQPRHEQL